MILAFTGQKGGVGKSTTAICVATELVARGKRVLLVDADPQGTIRTWGEVAAEQDRRVPTIVAMGANMHRPEHLPTMAAGYDATIIDCPPRAGDIQRSALMVADLALFPCGPAAPDAWALASSLEVLNEARTLRPELLAAVVITRKQGSTAVGRSAREVLEQGGLPVLRAELGYRVAYQEALAAGQGATDYAPLSDAADEVRRLADELGAMLGETKRKQTKQVRRKADGKQQGKRGKGKQAGSDDPQAPGGS